MNHFQAMTFLAALSPTSFRLVVLGASAFMLYGAGRLMMSAVPSRIDRPMLRALLGVGVVLAVAIVAIMMDRPEVALHLPIACATAAMTIGVGSLIVGRPQPAGRAGNASWALVIPAIAITLFAGLGGRFDGVPLAALVTYGLVAIRSWRENAVEMSSDDGPPMPARASSRGMALAMWAGGLALAALAGLLVMLGLPALETAGVASDALAVSFLLAPAIVVPIFFELMPPCRTLDWNGSVSVLTRFALINLCFVLPATTLVIADAGVLRALWPSAAFEKTTTQPASASTPSTTLSTTAPSTAESAQGPLDDAEPIETGPKLAFPMLPAVPLRADLLVLAGAALLMIPLAIGSQRPGMMEAGVLLLCYLFDLVLVMSSVWRR